MANKDARTLDALVIEDEAGLQDALVTRLSMEGLGVIGFSSAEAAQAWLKNNKARVLVLDLSLPGQDGMAWLRSLDDRTSLGLVVITGRSAEGARLEARQLGADDYLTKPLNLDEVALTVRNLLTRLPADAHWIFDHLNWALIPPGAEPIPLTALEVTFLNALSKAPGEAIDRKAIVTAMHMDPRTYDYRRMEVMVRRLRAKIEKHTRQSAPIQTARGVGYAFTATLATHHRTSSQSA